MIFGTSFLFRLAYFFTAFAPSLFITSLIMKNNYFSKFIKTNNKILNSMLLNWISFLLIILVFIFAIYIRMNLIKNRKNNSNHVKGIVANFNMVAEDDMSKSTKFIKVQDNPKVNSGFVQFTISILVPTFFLNSVQKNQIYISLIIIILFFLLFMLSNDNFPNVILPFFGIQLIVTGDNFNLFYLTKYSDQLCGVKSLNRIGNGGKLSRTYLITDEEYE